MMKRLVTCALALARPQCQRRFLSVESEIEKLQKELSDISSKIKHIDDNKAANALVALYASRHIRNLDIKRSLHIFAEPSYNSAIYCHDNLPVILAYYISALDTLPDGLNAMPSILSVRDTLLQSFRRLVDCEIPTTVEKEKCFRDILEEIENAHAEREILQTTAAGILELKEHLSRHRRALVELKRSSPRWNRIRLTEADILTYEDIENIQEPLNFCNRCMIMYNFLSRMQLNLEGDKTSEKRVGMVDLEINLEKVVRSAVDEAKEICIDYYGDCPDAKFVISADSKMLRFPYMSTTIRYIIVELMKNAFRATVVAHMKKNESGIVTCDDMPPVQILIHIKEGIEHACICISDEGLGMTKEGLDMAMAYSYTSVCKPAMSIDKDGVVTVDEAPSALAGYGYGLPMSRVYAQSFGGDLVLQTMEGYGTRAYYYIKLAYFDLTGTLNQVVH